jgi:hypothetical protein
VACSIYRILLELDLRYIKYSHAEVMSRGRSFHGWSIKWQLLAEEHWQDCHAPVNADVAVGLEDAV